MDKQIYLHPIFHELNNNFRFFLAGVNMLSIPAFQKLTISSHGGRMSEIGISVEYDGIVCLKCDIREVLENFNKAVGLEVHGDKIHCNINELLNFQARQIAVSLFNILENSKFNKKINKTDIFKFTKHIRNGAAHNNHFTFDTDSISKLPVTWRNKVIVPSLNGKKVFNDFLSPADLIILMSDISEIIK